MQSLSSRTAAFTDSVIRRMTRICLQCGAVNLSQGFPDFDPPQEILDRLAEVAKEGPHQYSVTWGAQNFREHPKALILCNPSNPCGKVFTRDELLTIAALAEKYDVYVITDEVYEHLVYAPHRHTYFATLPGMWERTLSCSSLSKTYSITGWRLGYIIAPAPIIERAKKVHDFLTVGAAAPLQEAVIPGLRFGDEYYQGLLATYTEKRKLMLDGLAALGIPHNEPEGAYYILLDISRYGWDDDYQFCEQLAQRVGVGAVPGSSFFKEPENRYIRLHFAKKNETLTAALDRLASMDAKMKR